MRSDRWSIRGASAPADGMYSISNTDLAKAVRLLSAFSDTKGDTIRENEDRRQARLLVRKFQKRMKTAK